MSHTPRPWEVVDDRGGLVVTQGGLRGVAQLYRQGDFERGDLVNPRASQAKDNAHLISAAPDLLEAADMARAVLEVVVPCNEAERLALAMCLAAIGKARGA